MAGAGAPQFKSVDGRGLCIPIVASQWHDVIMDALVAGAARRLEQAGVLDAPVIRVPGSFELPLVASHVLGQGADGVVALGVVIRGGTPHFDYVCEAATDGLTRVALDHGKPVGFGVLTCDTEQQALDRAGLPESREDKGAEAVEAVLATLQALREASARLGS